MMKTKSKVQTLVWEGKSLKLIDQRKLPLNIEYMVCDTYEKTGDAIKEMVVRGAPAIGVTAAYGVAIAGIEYSGLSRQDFFKFIEKAIKFLSSSRPTAVNLFWALERMKEVLNKNKDLEIEAIRQSLIQEAQKIEIEDVSINRKIGENGLKAFDNFKGSVKILTHCNAGALATAGYGTALGVVRSLASAGKIRYVVVDETRPYLQGARLTAWELEQEGIPFFIITDNAAAYMMSTGEVDGVIVGADRIASNGDSANKVGTLGISICASYYRIPFFIAAPLSTIDMGIENGEKIPIEERGAREIREVMGTKIISDEMPVKNPAFDVTPAENITAIITEKGVIKPPYRENIALAFGK